MKKQKTAKRYYMILFNGQEASFSRKNEWAMGPGRFRRFTRDAFMHTLIAGEEQA